MTETLNEPRIVVGIDGSEPSKQALRWAIVQARLTGATVEAVTAWEYPVWYGWAAGANADDLIRASEEVLSETVTEVTGERSPAHVRTRVVQGHPAYMLIQQAAGAQLLVLGSRGHGGFAGTLLGSVSQYCVQHAPCPVVVIRGAHQ